MSERSKPKRAAEEIAKLKGKGASRDEAGEAVLSAAHLADSPETSPGLRSLAAWYRDELSRNPDDTARRETLMAAWTAKASGFTS